MDLGAEAWAVGGMGCLRVRLTAATGRRVGSPHGKRTAKRMAYVWETCATSICFRSNPTPGGLSVNMYPVLYTVPMYVIDVIPLSRTAPGVLSYRSQEKRLPGTIVSIVLRKKPTQGIVVGCVPVQEAKEMLKNARFLLSKSAPSASGVLPHAILQAAEETAAYHATTVGAVLSAVFSEYARLELPLPELVYTPGTGFAREPIELPLSKRVEMYSRHVEGMSQAGRAVLLVVPTLPELEFWKHTLAIHKPLILSGSVTGARRTKTLETAASHQGLIISTPAFSWVPIQHLGMICVDRVSAGTYMFPKRPYLSMAHALESLARARELPFLVGDFPLPIEYRPDPASAPKHSLLSPVKLIDARKDPDALEVSVTWNAVPLPAIEKIRTALSEGKRAIVLATRKGYAPAVVCRDCGQAQTDDRDVPLTFSVAGGKRALVSSDGMSVLSPKMNCSRCSSWNLLPLGIGIERIEEELKSAFPEVSIHTATPEILAGPRKIKTLLSEASAPGTILIGTEALLPWLYAHPGPESIGIIASADSLLSLPFWRARERFVRLAYFFSGLCSELVLVTRRPEDTAVLALRKPESEDFWQEETQMREALGYPPFGTIVTLSVEGSELAVDRMSKRILEDIAEHSPTLLPSRNVQAGTMKRSIVLMIPEGLWPNESLASYVRTLPPSVRIRIDPESFW